jgi:hypothetical protein
LLLAWLPPRLGFGRPLLAGMLLQWLGVGALLLGPAEAGWYLANVAFASSWNFVLPLLFGLNAQLDAGGGGAVWAGFLSKVGLASGPMIGALVLGAERYDLLVAAALALLGAACAAAWPPARNADRRAGL